MNTERMESEQENILTKEALLVPPVEVRDWEFGDRISRENIASFLIKSFAVSRGKADVQGAFFKWVEVKSGFNVSQTIRNIQENGWVSMSPEEKAKFREMYKMVSKHRERDTVDEDLDKGLAGEIGRIYTEYGYLEGESLRSIFDFEKIDTMSDFNQAASSYFNRSKS